MELDLKKNTHQFYEKAVWQPFSCETMRENIVPDSCADIARIIETTGHACVISREITGDGRFCAGGSVHVSVLYIPEKGDGPCALHYQIPFQCYGDGQDIGSCDFLDIRAELRHIDTRLLNPRKVLTRVDLTLYPGGCLRRNLLLCTDMAQPDETLQLMQTKKEIRVIAGISEKEFSFMEELSLSPGRQPVEEVLSARYDIRGADTKLIGSKLVVKGLLAAAVLYRESGNRIALLQQELPFSQILDGAGFVEEDEFETVFRPLSVECRIGTESAPEDPHMLTLSVMMRTRAAAHRRETVAFIADLYSTDCPVTCQRMELELAEEDQRLTRRLNVRELLETGIAVRQVLDTRLQCGGMQISGSEMEIPLWATCLYLDENEVVRSVSKEFSVTAGLELPQLVQADGTVFCQGDLMSSIQPDGIELRFPLECQVDVCRRVRNTCVNGVETQEESGEQAPRPSLILRKFSPDESLWSVAKQYRTTCRSILEVNGIEEESAIPVDRLLLIPKAR